VKDSKVPHSHSQSNLSDIPYRGDLACLPKTPPVPAAVASPVKGRDLLTASRSMLHAEPSCTEYKCCKDRTFTS
jgi:hypothetical protein